MLSCGKLLLLALMFDPPQADPPHAIDPIRPAANAAAEARKIQFFIVLSS
jgi:hypothetical protein